MMFFRQPGKFLLIFIFLLSVKPRLNAQDSTMLQLPAQWTLQQCFDYALKNNIQLNSLRLSKMSSDQDLLLSRAAKLPNLTGSVSQDLNGGKSVTAAGNSSYRVNTTGNYGVNSSVTLFQGGYLNNDIKQKNLLTQVAGLNIAQQVNDITVLITQAYLNILLAKENIVYVQDVVATSEAQVKQGQQQYDVGSIALIGLVQLKAQLSNDRYLLVTAENQHRQNKLVLKQLLQLPSSYNFEIQEPDTLITNTRLYALQEVQDSALANRPEVKSSELGIQVSNLDLAKARAGYLPTLTAGGALGSSYVSGGANSAYFKQMDNNFYQQIGLTLSVPIFTRRVVKTNVEKAKIEVDQSKLVLQDTKTNLTQTIEQSYIDVLNAQSQYDAAVEQLKYSQEGYRIASEQLKVGAANIVVFLQQKNLYIQALQSYIQAKYNAALNIRIYDFYRGIPVKL
ncbi:TolC family protein [Chitinophaga ginsengisegetis]|uniref:TolC family protein n=1 Tax=Chitinophaga ginsengisegetis TaxID=393003 RepID=UPI001D052A59|nr:TolC family protein [Chitinophaga ginsengisegetis]MDR6570377.1 outer membrane protein [Chitinophaga ginsengisegetis]MDR6650111.1 outer membrane protein [Chitinophaga ginsengisegetis]MDR6656248.1 outer membrane protein [Chitinophaga ginsengisegetis]